MRLANKLLFLLLISSAIMLTSCGKKDAADSKKTDTQVVAKVNGDEITIHQVNFQLSRMGQMNEAQSKVAAKQVLSRLVELQLLKQQAIEQKLDKNPGVLQALEASKDQLLAQAYLEMSMAKAPKPSTSTVDSFYKDRPELFENRRIYRLQELVVNIDKAKFAETQQALKDIKGINEIATWLKDKNYPFSVNSNVKAAEQLPSDLLKKLQTLKDGDAVIISSENSFNIIHLVASQPMPIARSKATPIIEQYYMNQNKTNLAKKEMTALNEKAKIEFIGTFADMKKADLTNPNSITSKDAVDVKAEIAKPADSSAQKTSKSNASKSSIDKGLSGL